MALTVESSFLVAQQQRLRAAWEQRRAFARRARAEADALLEANARLDTQFDEESAEGDTTAVERGRLLVLAVDADAAAEAVASALARIDDGSYGTCERCHHPIAVERLEALPETSLCVVCKAGRQFY